MPTAHDISGLVFKNSSVILLARIVGPSGAPITQSMIGAAQYTIYRLDPSDPDSETAVTGHTARSLAVSDIVFDTLQKDSLWDADAVGYNFKHVVDTSSQQAFTAAGLLYRVRHELTVPGGQMIVVRFKLRAI